MKKTLIILCSLFLLSCSDANDKSLCSITVDTVNVIDSLSIKDTTYYLVHRVSGWSDKTESLELYDKKPTFDHCSKSSIKAIYGDSLESSQTVSHVYLEPSENSLLIEYANDNLGHSLNQSLRLEVKPQTQK